MISFRSFSTKLLALCIVHCALSTLLYAQVPACSIDTVNGQAVYRYEVRKSEGLYRISKNFGVTQEQILKLNPELEQSGLKLGQSIYVPIVEQTDTAQYETHTLQPKETLYGLSRRYQVSIEELQRLNPETSARMAIGDKLLIRKKVIAAPVETPAPAVAEPMPAPAVETVAPAEEEAKPIVKEVVPAVEEAAPVVEEVVPVEEEVVPVEEEAILPLTEEIAEQVLSLVSSSSLPLRLAFLLPLHTDATKRDASMNRFVDFYKGALLAINEAQKSGQRFDIYCYDIEKSDVRIRQVLQQPELLNADAIIGPAYPAQVTYASLFAKQNKVPTIIPFTSKVNDIDINPYLIRFNPNEELEAAALVEHLLPRKDSIQLVFVDSEASGSTLVKTFRQAAAEAGLPWVSTTSRMILGDSLGQSLARDKENILVFNADKYSGVQVLMNKVLNQKNGCELTLLGRYSWASERIALPMLYTSVFHEPVSDTYNAQIEHYFGSERASSAPRYDILGYDLTKMTIARLLAAQQATTDAARDAAWGVAYEGIQSNVRLSRSNEESGLVNTAIEILRK